METKKNNKVTVPYGEALYRQNGCEACHGKNGAGNPSKKTRIDFRNPSNFKHGSSVIEMMKTIEIGIPEVKPSYSHFSEADRRAIAEYIYSFR